MKNRKYKLEKSIRKLFPGLNLSSRSISLPEHVKNYMENPGKIFWKIMNPNLNFFAWLSNWVWVGPFLNFAKFKSLKSLVKFHKIYRLFQISLPIYNRILFFLWFTVWNFIDGSTKVSFRL